MNSQNSPLGSARADTEGVGGINPDFSKYADGLVPAIIQDAVSSKVLMLGFMNQEALSKTTAEGKVTFFSRTKQRLWTKGETSNNFLLVKEIINDCDNDTLLIKASPTGPVCHTGADTCFNENNSSFSLEKLEAIIDDRKNNPTDSSYTSSLFVKGINKIAQKVGEEAVELVIESKDENKERFLSEAADLLYHYLVLLQAKSYKLNDVVNVLAGRHK
jgi:phosphoribosyl-ATP pyrophosphohydrolase/phosphoribosyl-AMP cyclohydrolase